MALDVETEIAATLTDPNALMVYYQSGIDASQFADPKMAEMYSFASDYFLNFAAMRGAPTLDVLRERFPDYDALTQGAAGAAPSYLSKKLKDQYCEFQLTDALRMGVENMGLDAEQKVKMLRDTLSVIVDNVTPRQQKIVYGDGESMELYKKMANAKLAEVGAPYPFEELNVETGGIKPGELAVLVAPTGKGKAQPLYSKVLTEHGFKPMGEIRVGDKVRTRRGTLARVIGVYPQGKKRAYRVHLADGRHADCCIDHLWTTAYKTKANGIPCVSERTMTLGEMIARGLMSGKAYRWRVPVNDAVEMSRKELPIDPYVLGVLIGDGCLSQVPGGSLAFSSVEDDVVNSLCERLGEDYAVKKVNADNCSYGISYLPKWNMNPLSSAVVDLGLNVKSYEKFIPADYLGASAEQRFDLLRGLMDTDGCMMGNGGKTYSTASKRLADDVVSLCRSLGMCARARMKRRAGKSDEWVVSVMTAESITSSGKHECRERAHDAVANRKFLHRYVSIVDVEDLGFDTEMQCIMVDDPEHLYLTDDYIVTHNTWFAAKTALEAARQGWNVYFASLELDPYDIGRRTELLHVNRDQIVVPVDKFLKGIEMPRYVQALDRARDEIGGLPGKLVIDQPPMPERTPSALIQNAKMCGCNFVVIDQLQFVKKNPKIQSLYEQTADCIYTLKNLIASPSDNQKMPVLLLHQMTREGVKNAKDGIGTAQDIAHSSVVEQLADVIWALGCTEEEENISVMKLVTLKTRRYGRMGYKLRWELKYQALIDLMRDDNGNPRTIR
ncbi:DNA helicase [Eggerthella phage LE2-3]|nr:DNA helicase [Eggerthella phage LE2-3]